MPCSERFRPGLNSQLSARARYLVAYAVNTGKLVRPDSCERCNDTGRAIHAHHADYASPLTVEWLCVPCHRREHYAALTEPDVSLKVTICREVARELKRVAVAADRPMRSLVAEAITEYLALEATA